MPQNPIEDAILTLQNGLSAMPFDFAFLGGSVLSLLVTDPTVDTIRVTKDVDIMVDVRTRRQFHKTEALLAKAGFRHDMREDAPICRWIYDDVTVDILPIRDEVLGWRSKWFEDALANALETDCGGQRIKIVSAPYFIALKTEAFEDRGKGDFLTSTDFEDIICLINGRSTVAAEIAACENLKKPLAAKFGEYLGQPGLLDAIEGFVQTEEEPDERMKVIVAAFENIAKLDR